MKKGFLFLLLLLPLGLLAQKFTISGYVKDKNSGESLIGANVLVKTSLSGTSTNTYGFYSLTLPSGTVNILCTYVGYEAEKITFNLQKDTTIHTELGEAKMLKEVEVRAGEEAIQESSQMGSAHIPTAQIKSLPAQVV